MLYRTPNDSSHKPVLEHLTRLVSIPRKRKYFSTFLERSCRVEDEKLSEEIYDNIVLKDEEMHSQKLKELPLDRVSITHLSEEYCGHRLFQVHRLDMETSGIIVQAKHESACAELCRQFRERMVNDDIYTLQLTIEELILLMKIA